MITMEDWNRMERGLPPKKPVIIERPDPEPPVVENQIRFEDVPIRSSGLKLLAKQIDSRKNAEGIAFIGYRVSIETEPGKNLEGWIAEGDFVRLLPYLRENSDPRVINAL